MTISAVLQILGSQTTSTGAGTQLVWTEEARKHTSRVWEMTWGVGGCWKELLVYPGNPEPK